MQQSFQVFDFAEPATGSQLRAFVPWGGGRGWISISGTFSGASASVSIGVACDAGALGGKSVSPIPGPFPITAAGTYAFEAPAGTLIITSPFLAGGDSLIVTADVIKIG